MGGVAAHFSTEESPGAASLATMLQAIPHRGRILDSTQCGAVTLGVVTQEDRTDAWLDAHDGWAAAVTGVIDNGRELSDELRFRGHTPTSASPAWVVIELLRAFGEDGPRRLRGVFAVVATDGKRLICFRDQVGYASLFFRQDGSVAHVGSEAKQVVAGAGIAKEPDFAVLEQIFYQSDDEATPCALRGVERLPKATLLTIDRWRSRSHLYWDPTAFLEKGRISPTDIQDTFDALMTQAADRMVTEHCSASLSGGIDSPAVVAYAAPRYRALTDRGMPCLTAVYPNHPSVDERKYTELVAERLDVPLLEYEPQAPALDRLADWMQLVDGPVPAIALPYYEEHYRKVRSLGATTVLSGELAEFVVDTSMYLLVHLLTHGRFTALRDQIRNRRSRGHSTLAIGRQLVAPLVPSPLVRWRLRRDPANIPQWVDRSRANEAAVQSVVNPARRWSKLQFAAFTGPGLSAEAEQICAQICGVQPRRPWTDIDLWEFFLGLRAEDKFPSGQRKALVRRLLRGRVPEEILDRRDKTLFNESIMKTIDYPELRRWLVAPSWRLPGVDYDRLRDLLDREALDLTDFLWAKHLASTNAFLAQW